MITKASAYARLLVLKRAVYLKRLDILGFKTFANRTVIEFPLGVTAVVGPNGSGKSNVTDAIRWVLGEQSFSALRCRRTEDLIYSGGGKRAPLGLAEVSLTIDNTDRTLPLDFNEVTITRRSHRSGENEYFINKTRVRLRDIQEATAPLAQSYTLINQGMVDAALTLRPDERRSLFEDAAAISVSVSRKAEAERRLRQTEENLSRLNDLVSEIEPRLRTLKRQAREAEQVQDLEQALQTALTSHFRQQWHSALEAVQNTEASVAERHGALQKLHTQQATLGAELVAARSARHEAQIALTRHIETLQQHHQQRDALRHEQAVLLERRNAIETRVADAQAALEALAKDTADYHQAEQAALRQVQAVEETLREHTQALAILEAQEHAGLQQRQQIQAALEAARERVFASQAALADAERQQQQALERQRRLESDQAALTATLASINEQHAHQQAHLATSQTVYETTAAALETAIKAEQDAQATITTRREALQASEAALSGSRRDLDAVSSRLEALRRTASSGTGTPHGVREALRWSERHQRHFALVASIIEVPANLETALEVALGGRLQNIVVERWEDAEAAIEELKRTDAGRATFLPLDTLRTNRQASAPSGPGIIGVASALVTYSQPYDRVVQYLLGRTLVVDTLTTARRILRELDGGWSVVTVGGEQVNTSGAMTGGGRIRETGTLRRERELRELPDHVEAAQARYQQHETALKFAQTELASAEEAARQAEQHRRAARHAHDRSHDAVEQQRRLLARVEQEQDWHRSRAEHLQREHAEATRKREQAETTLNASTAAEAEANEAFETARQAASKAQAAGRSSDERLLAARSALAHHQANVATATEALRALREHHERQRHHHQQAIDRLEQSTIDHEQLDHLIAASEAAIEAKLNEISIHRDAMTPLQTAVDEASAALTTLEDTERAVSQALLQAQSDLGRAETAHAAATTRRDQIWERCAEENIDIEALAAKPLEAAPPDDPAMIEQLRSRLRRMGAINPLAPQEFAETNERYHFLTTQITDVEQAAQALRELIGTLDAAMNERFAATFSAVAEEFSATFTRLFGGGTAQLLLSDEQHGIEIVAQPPGKRRQPLSLLSGGERSLTAVALLVALLRVNPTPFCVMDEVDAALDEANVVRFREVLREMSERTQFIIVTHNRGTVEVAGTLYGVTMQPDGASKILSLQMDDLVETEAGAITYVSTNL